MQPTLKFKKPLLASALILGAGITFNASADVFPVFAESIPDVDVAPAVGTQISFGESIIGNKNGGFCQLAGISHISEADLLFDVGADNVNANSGNTTADSPLSTGVGALQACITGADVVGEIIVLEIDGANASTVQVSVPDVIGTGWVYTPTADSCVVDFDGGSDAEDFCRPLTTNTVSGVGMSGTQADGLNTGDTGDEIPETALGYADIVGKTRMVLAGRITLTDVIPQGTVISSNIIVQVTYE